MADRISRRELKAPDSFIKTGFSLTSFIYENLRVFVIGLSSVVAILIFLALYSEYSKSQENKASYALAQAEQTLKNAKGEFSEDSEKLFEEVASKYSATFAGVSAQLKLADVYFGRKEYDRAFELFEDVYKDSDSKLLRSISLVNMAYIREIKKDYQTSLGFFNKLIAGSFEIFKIQAYFGKSRCLEKLLETVKAKETYNLIISKYPNSEHAKTARKYISMLDY